MWRNFSKYLSSLRTISRVAIITDTTVSRLYGHTALEAVRTAGKEGNLFSFPAGEKSKNSATKKRLDEKLLQNGFGRDSLMIALGGGVVGDIAGFVAATYHRGISYVQVPTTLLAMVDSSIGGKTGIDTPYGKNLIGAFWQPSRVFIDPLFLQTLSPQHMTSGLLEALKMVLLFGPEHLDDVLSKKCVQLISRVVSWKARIVSEDEKEEGERALLNFGHTIGHALEKTSGYTMLHGIAVGYGMLVEAKIAEHLGILSSAGFAKIRTVLEELDIHGRHLAKFSHASIIAATKSDKKNRANEVRYVVLANLGKPYIKGGEYTHPVTDKIVQSAFKLVAKS